MRAAAGIQIPPIPPIPPTRSPPSSPSPAIPSSLHSPSGLTSHRHRHLASSSPPPSPSIFSVQPTRPTGAISRHLLHRQRLGSGATPSSPLSPVNLSKSIPLANRLLRRQRLADRLLRRQLSSPTPTSSANAVLPPLPSSPTPTSPDKRRQAPFSPVDSVSPTVFSDDDCLLFCLFSSSSSSLCPEPRRRNNDDSVLPTVFSDDDHLSFSPKIPPNDRLPSPLRRPSDRLLIQSTGYLLLRQNQIGLPSDADPDL